MVAVSTVWAVTGATRGMGLEFCTQVVFSIIECTGVHIKSFYVQLVTMLNLLQILALANTKVVAGARPGENADDLEDLSRKYQGRVMIVEMELLDKTSVKVS